MTEQPKKCQCRAGHECQQPVYETYNYCKGCLRDIIQAYYPTTWREETARVFHLSLESQKMREK